MTVAQCAVCGIWNDLDIPKHLMDQRLKSWCRRCHKISPHLVEAVTKLNEFGHRVEDVV